MYGVSVEDVGNCVGGGMGKCGEGMNKCFGVCGEVRGEVWKSVLGCGERYGKVCWSLGGGVRKCGEVLGEVWGNALGCAGRGVLGGVE